MKIYIACDYKGILVKKELTEYLKNKGNEVLEIGISNFDGDGYQDFAFKLGRLVSSDKNSFGILICENGIGMSIAANKVKGIRCVRALSVDDAYDGRCHNDCNVIALGAKYNIELLKEIVDKFLLSPSPDLERRKKRIEAIIKYEQGEYNEL